MPLTRYSTTLKSLSKGLDLSGKGLFVFSDPGGAKPLLALAQEYNKTGDLQVVSDREYAFYNDFGLEVEIIENDSALAGNIINYNPDFIFTATSYTSNLEKNVRRIARENNITSYSFIDHWTSMLARFSNGGEVIFPDRIFLIDQAAINIAISEGLPEDILRYIGNPFHSFLQRWKPKINREKFLGTLGIPSNRLICTYAPDPLSNVNGLDIYGYDELSATAEIKTIADILCDSITIVLKPHPNQNIERLELILGDKIVLLPAGTDSNILIYYSDLVVGFFSSFLLEAEIMGKPVYRMLLDNKNDPFSATIVGKVVSPVELQKELKHLIDVR